MKRYNSIPASMFQQSWWNNLGREHKYLLLTLMCLPIERRGGGCYQISLHRVAKYSGMNIQDVLNTVTALEDLSIVFFDSDFELLWIPYLTHCEIDGISPKGNQTKHILNNAELLPQCQLTDRFKILLEPLRDASSTPSQELLPIAVAKEVAESISIGEDGSLEQDRARMHYLQQKPSLFPSTEKQPSTIEVMDLWDGMGNAPIKPRETAERFILSKEGYDNAQYICEAVRDNSFLKANFSFAKSFKPSNVAQILAGEYLPDLKTERERQRKDDNSSVRPKMQSATEVIREQGMDIELTEAERIDSAEAFKKLRQKLSQEGGTV